MIDTRRVLTVLAVLLAVATVTVAAPASAVGPTRQGCTWRPTLLPLPPNTFDGQVTAGDGPWLAGLTYDEQSPNEGILWRDGRIAAHGSAFGLDTVLNAVNRTGVAAGNVSDAVGRPHAIRYREGRYEYLPETAGTSVALDVNSRGETTGLDGVTLVVWPPHDGPARVLPMPPNAAPVGRPAIDDDGTVVARTGRVAGTTMRWQTYRWTPDGSRVPVPVDEVQDIRQGRVVGAKREPVVAFGRELNGVATPAEREGISPERPMIAAGWEIGDGAARVYLGGVNAVGVNRAGVVVGAGAGGEPLLWEGLVPVELAAPPGFLPGSVTAVNDREAGGFVSPVVDGGVAPVRWRCR